MLPFASSVVSGQPNVAGMFKVLESQTFAAPFEDISLYTGMRDLSAWEVGGSAAVHRNFLRLTGERQSQKGWVASRSPLETESWSALLELRASGNSMHLYGDGERALFASLTRLQSSTKANGRRVHRHGDLARDQSGPH